MRASGLSFAVAALLLLSGLVVAFPFASAQSTVSVSIPLGSGEANGAPGYAPDSITVIVGVNNTVTWTNKDNASHTVSPMDTPSPTSWPGPGSGNLPVGQSYSYTFTVAGNYSYKCAYHSWMVGFIVVKPAASTAPEFPAAALAPTLFVIMAALVLVASRFWMSKRDGSVLPVA